MFERTSSKWVAMILTIFAGILVILIASILSSSVSLTLFIKNNRNFFTIGVSFLTDILTPTPLVSLIFPLILSVLYVSNTKSSCFKLLNCCWTVHGISSEQYCPNISDVFDLLMLTNAAASASVNLHVGWQ